jgi:hypothetical protein
MKAELILTPESSEEVDDVTALHKSLEEFKMVPSDDASILSWLYECCDEEYARGTIKSKHFLSKGGITTTVTLGLQDRPTKSKTSHKWFCSKHVTCGWSGNESECKLVNITDCPGPPVVRHQCPACNATCEHVSDL